MTPNFNPQTDLPGAAQVQVDLSVYRESLETVAPGITTLVNTTQAVGETWSDTLIRLLSSLQATDEQRKLLLEQATRASLGHPPAAIPSESASVPAWMKWTGAAAAAWFLLL
jgi:hypothetical protein